MFFFGAGATNIPKTVFDANRGCYNDVFIDITDVIEKKLAAMDCLVSQGYAGDYARKRLEAHDGAFGIDVRNADGLIVVSDFTTGFWAFRMDGFEGWNGNDWGMPNSSSAQDWDNGPDGVQRPIS